MKGSYFEHDGEIAYAVDDCTALVEALQSGDGNADLAHCMHGFTNPFLLHFWADYLRLPRSALYQKL